MKNILKSFELDITLGMLVRILESADFSGSRLTLRKNAVGENGPICQRDVQNCSLVGKIARKRQRNGIFDVPVGKNSHFRQRNTTPPYPPVHTSRFIQKELFP